MEHEPNRPLSKRTQYLVLAAVFAVMGAGLYLGSEWGPIADAYMNMSAPVLGTFGPLLGMTIAMYFSLVAAAGVTRHLKDRRDRAEGLIA